MRPDPIKFIHLRNYDQYGYAPKGGVTIAYTFIDGKIVFGRAKCHSKEIYNKKLGRAKAAGRLQSPSLRVPTLYVDDHEFVCSIYNGWEEIQTVKALGLF